MAPACPSSVLFRLSSTPLHPTHPSRLCLEQRIVGACLDGRWVCVGRDPKALGIIVPFQDHQTLHLTMGQLSPSAFFSECSLLRFVPFLTFFFIPRLLICKVVLIFCSLSWKDIFKNTQDREENRLEGQSQSDTFTEIYTPKKVWISSSKRLTLYWVMFSRCGSQTEL